MGCYANIDIVATDVDIQEKSKFVHDAGSKVRLC